MSELAARHAGDLPLTEVTVAYYLSDGITARASYPFDANTDSAEGLSKLSSEKRSEQVRVSPWTASTLTRAKALSGLSLPAISWPGLSSDFEESPGQAGRATERGRGYGSPKAIVAVFHLTAFAWGGSRLAPPPRDLVALAGQVVHL
jgi:hypothetical protein